MCNCLVEKRGYLPTSRSWKKSLQSRIFKPPKGRSDTQITCNWLSIRESVLRSIMDFLLIIRKWQSQKRACKDYNVPADRSDFFAFIGSHKRLWRVFPIILKATIPIGAAQRTRFGFLAVFASC
jgi:hypothetical protein